MYNFSHNTVAVADDAEHLVQARCCLLGTCSIYIFIFITGNYHRQHLQICRYVQICRICRYAKYKVLSIVKKFIRKIVRKEINYEAKVNTLNNEYDNHQALLVHQCISQGIMQLISKSYMISTLKISKGVNTEIEDIGVNKSLEELFELSDNIR